MNVLPKNQWMNPAPVIFTTPQPIPVQKNLVDLTRDKMRNYENKKKCLYVVISVNDH